MKPTGDWVAAPMNIHRINWLWGSTKAMAEAGIASMPKTWAEFNADCDKAVAAKLICLAHFSQDWTDATTFEVVVYGQNIDLFRKAFVEGDTEAMRSPEMIKAFEQMRLMVSKYMDPAIAGRDYDTVTGMIAKGKAAFMIMGDWQIGIFTAAGLKQGADYAVRAGADGLGQAGLHPQFGFGRVLQAERSRLCRGADAARASHHVAASSRPSSIRPRARSRRGWTSICRRGSTPASSSRRRLCRRRSPTGRWCARWRTT